MNTSRSRIVKAFGNLLKERRKALEISQEELGYRSGLDRTYISGLERGARNPSLTAIVSVSSGLGISTSCLLEHLEEEAGNARET